MNTAIEITELRKEFKGFTLDDVSFSLPAGYIMGFVGKNGAGKTTTIRLMLNMLERSGGEVKILGLNNRADEQRIKQDAAVVFDDIFFVGTWSVSEVGRAVRGFYRRWNTGLFNEYLGRFDLPGVPAPPQQRMARPTRRRAERTQPGRLHRGN